MTTNYRVRITDNIGNVSYLVRKGESLCLLSSAGVPLALSNLGARDTVLLQFGLEDAADAAAAVAVLGAHIPRGRTPAEAI